MTLTREEVQTLVDFEQQIQWRWTSGDPTGYMDALAEDVTYFDPFTEYLVVGREAVRGHFKRLHSGRGLARQEYQNETARPLSDDQVLLVFN
ncbi:nuclear transport factor 2 family protein [Streptomyces sp. NPDC051445]|uniref:nuclear transport factor 2 family protein n=1 Tax=Streptomyces sp. NPDC051445 TaxID=3365653 RepID=UPI0037AC3771